MAGSEGEKELEEQRKLPFPLLHPDELVLRADIEMSSAPCGTMRTVARSKKLDDRVGLKRGALRHF
jgi:hypothetical protein